MNLGDYEWLCRHVSVWLMHVELTAHLDSLDSPTSTSSITVLHSLISPFLSIISCSFNPVCLCIPHRSALSRQSLLRQTLPYHWSMNHPEVTHAAQLGSVIFLEATNTQTTAHGHKDFDITWPLTESACTVIDECHPYRHTCLPINAPHANCLAAMLLLHVMNAGGM